MNTAFALNGFSIIVAVWMLIVSNTVRGSGGKTDVESEQFNSTKHFDFNSSEQLQELPKFGYDPSYLDNGRLICPILAGTHKGLGRQFPLEQNGSFTNEVEMSFDIYLDENFQVNTHPFEIGKFPGMEGIYDTTAGWGGNPVGAEDSWSIRIGHLQQNIDGAVPIALYIYHPGMAGTYGTAVSANFALETLKTYRLTLYVKLNDVGTDNGIIKLLVDGVEKYSSDSWKLRLADSVHIKSVWLDAYIGGSTPSPVNTWVSLDNLEIRWKKCTDSDCKSNENRKSRPSPPGKIKFEVIKQ